ncbi:MAG: LamG-like jellyroll fold domain-containing protein [Chitinophagaceae bacterium]
MKKLFLVIVLGLLSAVCIPAKAQKALAVSWTGYAETNIKFSDFIKTSHSIAYRCMMQFPQAYEGPVIAENGTGTYFAGMGYKTNTLGVASLLLNIGTSTTTITYNYTTGEWTHIAMVATENGSNMSCKIYVNGVEKGNISYSKTDPQLPNGTLRIGKRTTGQTTGGRNAQFYGLVDDIAVFKTALSPAQVASLYANKDISTFSTVAPWATLDFNNTTTLKGSAALVKISSNKTNDAASLPLPTAQKSMQLPFKRGEEWYVIQGNDDVLGSHSGYASFCWDFMVNNQPQAGIYPNGTNGASVKASASGKVITVNQSKTSGESPSNMVEIQQGPNEVCAYLHIQKNSSTVKVNDQPLYGQALAVTGDVGAAVGAYHIHLAVTDKPDGTAGFITFPIAFSNYEVKQANGTWKFVSRGIPQKGEVIRIPLADDLPYTVSAVFKNTAAGEVQCYGYTYDQLKTKYDDLWNKGYRLSAISTHVLNGTLRYSAVWKPSNELETQVYGWALEDYQKKNDELFKQGWRIKLLDVCVLNGKPLYTAIWKKGNEGEMQLLGWTYEDLKKKYDELWPKGWRLNQIRMFNIPGGVRYSAVFTPGTQTETQVYGWNYTDFKNKYNELWPQGWRLSLLSNCVVNGKTLYTAVWKKSSAGEFQLYEAKYKDFREYYDNVFQDGWRLHLLNVW